MQRYATLDITLAFTAAEIFVRNRVPAGENYFSRTEPYDNRLYAFVALKDLGAHISGARDVPMIAWLLNEWDLGTTHRQRFSIAYSSRDPERISIVHKEYKNLFTFNRNELPLNFGDGGL